MRKKLEMGQKQATNRALFTCPSCAKSFTELQADQLFNFASGEFRCYVCRCVLVEEEVDSYKEDLVLARFNQQMEPFYSLLRDVESVRLAPDSVEPYPADIPHLRRF